RRRARPARRDAPGRRVPPPVPRCDLRQGDLLRGDGARPRLRGRRARARARAPTGRTRRGDDPDRHERAPLPARRRRLLRVSGRSHPHLLASRARAGPRARGARYHGRGLRSRAAHALLAPALGGGAAARRRERARARLSPVPDQRHRLARHGAARARARLRVPEERDPLRRKARRGIRPGGVMSPLRIAFVAYRGNMRCGGQGVYLWFLARGLAGLGHRVDGGVGPPSPDPMPFAHSVNPLRNHQYWGKWFSKDRRALIPQPRTRLLNPLEFYELGASYLGFLPEPL